MTPINNIEEIKYIENMWKLRTNELILSVIRFCKDIQAEENHGYKTTETPIIEAMDKVILELQKYKLDTEEL